MTTRISKLLNEMSNLNIDTLFITDEKNMYYYSGFYKGEGYLVISQSRLCVVTDSRYTEYASTVCTGFEIVDIRSVKYSDFVSDNEVCGFEDDSISYTQYKNMVSVIDNLVPVSDMVRKARRIKDLNEISSIRKAVEIGDKAFEYILGFIKPGMTEKEIAAEIDCFMKKNGGEKNSFDTITASGIRASQPHAIPTDEIVKYGDFLIMDYGCVVDGYCGDMTRTVAIGDVSDDKIAIYEAVLAAQLQAISSVRPGLSGRDIDAVARTSLDLKYKGKFSHSLGHSVGLDIHEAPAFSPCDESIIESGMVISVEPGVYLPGYTGVRIEDLILVTDTGCEILTKSPKGLIVIN